VLLLLCLMFARVLVVVTVLLLLLPVESMLARCVVVVWRGRIQLLCHRTAELSLRVAVRLCAVLLLLFAVLHC